MPTFVPNGESRRDTAVLLVGTAEEYGLPKRDIKVRSTGFVISDELASVLYSETENSGKRRTKKASGNRAEKIVTDKE